MERKKMSLSWVFKQLSSMEFKTEALIGGGGGLRVLPDEFLLKSTLITTGFKKNL